MENPKAKIVDKNTSIRKLAEVNNIDNFIDRYNRYCNRDNKLKYYYRNSKPKKNYRNNTIREKLKILSEIYIELIRLKKSDS